MKATRSGPFVALLSAAALSLSACGGGSGSGNDGGAAADADNPAPTAAIEACLKDSSTAAAAAETVDTTSSKKEGPWVLGFAAASTSANAYSVYFAAVLEYAVEQDSGFAKMIELDANYNASKQISDIQSLIRQKVDAILFSPTDNKAIEPALAQARKAGIPTIQVLSAFEPTENVTASVNVDLEKYYSTAAAHLFNAMGGTGEVAMIRTTAGISEDTVQTEAVDCVLGQYPGVKIVDSQFTNYATPQAQTAAEAWSVRFPELKGVLSVYAETSVGVYNALSQAGRMDAIKVSPNNAQNGWLKVVAANPSINLGGVDFPVSIANDALEVVHKVLSGETVPRGTLIGGDYIEPEEYAAMFDKTKPDSYWPNDLPADRQPAG